MTHIPTNVPLPQPDSVTEPFWSACAERRLVIQHCVECGAYQNPPRLLCLHCHGNYFDWRESAGTGRVYTYTVVHHPPAPALSEQVPYVVVVVRLDDCGDVLLTSNLVGENVADVAVNRTVRVCWDDASGAWLPRFELV